MPKSIIDIAKQIRNQWFINPRTRVQENERKNKKKMRQESKKIIKDSD